ncbi:MAG: thioredoxin family protein [Rhodospirillales bacterium]
MILALALLGGLILNLMPCVLPVLSMKLLAVIGHGGGDRRSVRAGFVATALGILSSFMVLAAALIALKATGAAVGWGLQFQQPWFLTGMILVVTLFACNLWGLFELPLPRAFAAASERAVEVRGQAGHFLTGALATLLATPCSAPFLGTAIGFALSRGPIEIVLVFAAVALGLALPYLGVAAFPGLAIRLPKPGPWMRTLRRILGLALAGTAAWLSWVLAGSVGPTGAGAVAAIAAAVVLLLAVRHRLPERLRPLTLVAGSLLAVGAFMVAANPGLRTPAPAAGEDAAAGLWQPFEPERIAELVADGKVIWVNVTADWCLTCKVNERFVLGRHPVLPRLSQSGVVAMRGDWTQPDEAIVHYLAGFGRYGIPFDAVYGPALTTGEALPELLTEAAALSALDRAGASVNAAAR